MFRRCLLVVLACSLGCSAGAATLPHLAAKDLSGRLEDTAQLLSGTAALVIVGFTEASSDPCQAWEDRLWELRGPDTRYRILSVIPLERVPGLLVPWIASRVRSKTPKPRFGWVLLARRGKKAWESCLGYVGKADKDAAFVAVTDPTGRIVGITQGPPTAERVAAVEAELRMVFVK